jgi:tartrate-resistant acid phosphatase type 5
MNTLRSSFLAACALCLTATLFAEQSAPASLSEAFLREVPSPYKEELISLHPQIADADQQAALKIMEANPTAALALTLRCMGQQPDEFNFLMAQLRTDSDPSHRLLILTQSLRGQIRSLEQANRPLHSPQAVSSEAETTSSDRISQVKTWLTERVLTDTDTAVALEAARDLRKLDWGLNSRLLLKAADNAHAHTNTAGEAALRKEADDWLTWDEQINLPTFLRTPPPVFSVAPADKPIRVLAFGDFGNGSPAQMHLAETMLSYHRQYPFDFGITLGDNFYPRGVTSPEDPHWANDWEKPYGPLGLKFYPTLGNHDYLPPDGPAAEVLYTQHSKTWNMPATFYTFTAGPIQFFAIDTEELSDTYVYQKQLAWLDAEIAKSKARWKIVYGHYQVYSATRGDEQNLIDRLVPVLRNRVNLYLCGHDHNLQQLQTESGVHYFVDGAGGASLYDFTQKDYARSAFKAKQNGFMVIEADSDQLVLQIIGTDGDVLRREVITN